MQGTARELKSKSYAIFYFGLLHMDTQVLTYQHGLTYTSSVSVVLWLSSKEMDTETKVQTLEKGMNPAILPPAMCRLTFLTFVWQPVWEKEKSKFKTS